MFQVSAFVFFTVLQYCVCLKTWREYFDKLDKNKDYNLDQSELEFFIRDHSRTSMEASAREIMKKYDGNKDQMISLPELVNYLKAGSGEYSSVMTETAFNLADKDHDKQLTIEEFATFLSPPPDSELKRMQIKSAFEHMDVNKDGKVAVEEYFDDDETIEEEDKRYFTNKLDLNKDGFVDENEFFEVDKKDQDSLHAAWVEDLMNRIDGDKDNKVSLKEFEKSFRDVRYFFDDPESAVEHPDEEEDFDDHEDL
ncbi:Reticulocalbin-3 [Thelohanellus kitauei]|uniref:Reticulocalbin-3 n=1 Tax=Thelohanellus kitauei TaxID=669202 RepID=A0A0C2J670_THEKT|nr:Reticulocalbin-3 [Thelohanellus kitauei]